MSTRYNTGNQIESTDVRDMSDNAKNFDEFSNSTSDSFTDRLGRDRQTIEGTIRKAGFQPASFDFVTGGTLVSGDRNKAVFNPSPLGDNNWYAWQGAFPKVFSPNSTPATSGGFGENAWKPVTNNILAPAVRESIRRSYAEAGYNLVDGSFEVGGTLVNVNDVLLQERTGKAFSGPAGVVSAGTNPASVGFVDRSCDITVYAAVYNTIRSYTGPAEKIRCGGRVNIFDNCLGVFHRDSADTTTPDNDGTVLVDVLGRRWKRQFVGPVHTKWFGISGAGLLNAVATGIDVSVSPGVYTLQGGTFYTRIGQSVIGEDITSTILKLPDNAGATRGNLVEMDDYSYIHSITIDGNALNNISDMASWTTPDAAPFAQGIYTSRLQTNGNVLKSAVGAHIGKVVVRNTIKSCVVIVGSSTRADDIDLSDSVTDHHLYFSGCQSPRLGTVNCSGKTTSESVAFSTPPNTPADDIYIQNLTLRAIDKSLFYDQNQGSTYRPSYLNFRSWTQNSLLSAKIDTLVIDDLLLPFSSKRVLVERRWVVDISLMSIATVDAAGKTVLDVNNGRLSCDSLNLRLDGNSGLTDPEKSTVIRVSTDSASFNTSLNVGRCILNVDKNLNPFTIMILNSGSTINIDSLNLISQKGVVHRIAADSFNAKTVIGVKNVTGGFDKWCNSTESATTSAWYGDTSSDVKTITAGVSPTISGASVLKFNYAAPTNVTSFTADCNLQKFTVIGDGVATLQNTSLLKTTAGANILTELGRTYQFMISGGVAYQH